MAVDRLRSAADAAANDAQSSYLRFAVFGLYLAVVVGATTHEELLKGSMVTMPGLGVGLPIMGFYVLVPALFVLMHANLLLQLGLVAGHVARLRAAIQGIASDEERRLERALLPSSIISQFRFGDRRGSPFGMLLYLAFVISLILLPIGILVFVQVRFLPYHSEWVTWWHRGLIFADLCLIWLLWPRIVRTSAAQPPLEVEEAGPLPRGWGEALRRSLRASRVEGRRRGRSTAIVLAERVAAWARKEGARFPRRLRSHPGVLATSLVSIVFVSLIATMPDSAAPVQASSGDPCKDDASPDAAEVAAAEPVAYPQASETCQPWLLWRYFERVQLPAALKTAPPRTDYCLTYLLFEAPTTPLDMRRNLRVRNAKLVLAEPSAAQIKDLGEREAWGQIGRGVDLKGRDLRFADFSGSDLRKADLRGADLLGVDLVSANLRHATAADVPTTQYDGCDKALRVDVNDQTYCRTRISNANLGNADLRYANFWKTSMESVDLSYAKLEKAALNEADLRRGSLISADLRGANLYGARLDDAKLNQARLDGANLACAWVRRADLEAADLPMAVLLKARLDGARLEDAHLEGAYLAEARLSDAELGDTYLAGADLRAAVLEGARLGSGPRDRPFFGWVNFTDVQGEPAYDERSAKDPGELWRRIAPEALPPAGPSDDADAIQPLDELDYQARLYEMAYQDRLAALLTGRVCDPGADVPELQGLATRVLWDKDATKKVTTFHKKVALSLLRAASDATETGGAAPEDAVTGSSCPQAAAMPQGMRDGLRGLLVAPLGALAPSGGP
jgi:uncharacterized protein YjbI with pentapeptide repeats